MKNELGIVWFKRDLRLQDHAPLAAAQNSSLPLLYIYILEPEEWEAPENSLRHWQFQWQSIEQLNAQLANFDQQIAYCFGSAFAVFESLLQHFEIKQVWSYQESGTPRTYQRDNALKKLFVQHKVNWQEFQRDGIIRGLKNRKNWDRSWFAYVNSPVIENQFKIGGNVQWKNTFKLPEELVQQLKAYPKYYQKAGPIYAEKYLTNFLTERIYG
ncbi:MAG: deoxyribodipyrimidine photo-lyase, partial [Sphingomonadales bacterium]